VNNLKQADKLFLGKLPEKFIFYVGSAYPHKNLERLVNVFKRLSDEKSDIKLILVGKQDYFYERLKLYANNLSIYEFGWWI
jgi:glycosyltransferase involved in cell wall biosynthesis